MKDANLKMQGRVNGMLLEMHVCTSIPMDYLKG